MKRKLITLLITSMLITAFAGCSGKPATSVTPVPTRPVATEAAKPTEKVEPTAETTKPAVTTAPTAEPTNATVTETPVPTMEPTVEPTNTPEPTATSTPTAIPTIHEHEWYEIERIDATCTEDGKITYKCDCGEIMEAVIGAFDHTPETVTTEATVDMEGSIVVRCAVCGEELSRETLPRLTPTNSPVPTNTPTNTPTPTKEPKATNTPTNTPTPTPETQYMTVVVNDIYTDRVTGERLAKITRGTWEYPLGSETRKWYALAAGKRAYIEGENGVISCAFDSAETSLLTNFNWKIEESGGTMQMVYCTNAQYPATMEVNYFYLVRREGITPTPVPTTEGQTSEWKDIHQDADVVYDIRFANFETVRAGILGDVIAPCFDVFWDVPMPTEIEGCELLCWVRKNVVNNKGTAVYFQNDPSRTHFYFDDNNMVIGYHFWGSSRTVIEPGDVLEAIIYITTPNTDGSRGSTTTYFGRGYYTVTGEEVWY